VRETWKREKGKELRNEWEKLKEEGSWKERAGKGREGGGEEGGTGESREHKGENEDVGRTRRPGCRRRTTMIRTSQNVAK